MLSSQLSPLQRVYSIWFKVFFMRMWRHWLFKQKTYSTVHNCISLNSYVCMELNAHGLLNLIFHCFEENSFDNFVSWLCSSQPCESFFRNLKSMSSTFSTIVNCSVLDAIHKLERLQHLADIKAYDFLGRNNVIIHFPKTRFLNASHEKQDKIYPEVRRIEDTVSINGIKKVMEEAKKSTWNKIKYLGMKVPILEADKIQVDFCQTSPEDFLDPINAEDIQRFEAVIEDEIYPR